MALHNLESESPHLILLYEALVLVFLCVLELQAYSLFLVKPSFRLCSMISIQSIFILYILHILYFYVFVCVADICEYTINLKKCMKL